MLPHGFLPTRHAKTNGPTTAAKVSAAISARAFKGISAMIFPLAFGRYGSSQQHPSGELSRQRFLRHKGNHRYLASVELIDAGELPPRRGLQSGAHQIFQSLRETGCAIKADIGTRSRKLVPVM
jgi:hypothetical protein